MIDTHCHLNFTVFDSNIEFVTKNAKKAGVTKIVVPGIDIESSQKAYQIAEQYPGFIYPTVGFHPYESERFPDIDSLEKLASLNIVAIGECGLDYHLYKDEKADGKKDHQKQLFEKHIEIANKKNLPLIIHCRNAFDDMFDILDSQITMPKGVFHCFGGGQKDLEDALKRNFYIGIDGNITYSKQLQMLCPLIPSDRLLIETDAPYLTPIPYRGKPNKPQYLIYILKHISMLLDSDTESIDKQTTTNSLKLFSLN